MSKLFSTRVDDLAQRLGNSGAAGNAVNSSTLGLHRDLERSYARLLRAGQSPHRFTRLRKVDERSLRELAASLGLDCWADEAHGDVKVISITGKIIVVDVGFDVASDLVQSCTLVLASEDGLQEEIIADGRDAMLRHLNTGRLDLFAANLKKLAFLDHFSDPGSGLSLFHALDVIREALNKKLVLGVAGHEQAIGGASYLVLPIVYHKTRAQLGSRGSTDLQKEYMASVEIEEQLIGCSYDQGIIDQFTQEDHNEKPVFRYPKSWLDAAGNWQPAKLIHTSRYKEGLRYKLVFDPPIMLPKPMLSLIGGHTEGKVQCEEASLPECVLREVEGPEGTYTVVTELSSDTPLISIHEVAFFHPKEVAQILSVARQVAVMHQLVESLGTVCKVDPVKADHRFSVQIELMQDSAAIIDHKYAIRLRIEETRQSTSTITIKPDSSISCTRTGQKESFAKYIKLVEDIPIATIAAARLPP